MSDTSPSASSFGTPAFSPDHGGRWPHVYDDGVGVGTLSYENVQEGYTQTDLAAPVASVNEKPKRTVTQSLSSYENYIPSSSSSASGYQPNIFVTDTSSGKDTHIRRSASGPVRNNDSEKGANAEKSLNGGHHRTNSQQSAGSSISTSSSTLQHPSASSSNRAGIRRRRNKRGNRGSSKGGGSGGGTAHEGNGKEQRTAHEEFSFASYLKREFSFVRYDQNNNGEVEIERVVNFFTLPFYLEKVCVCCCVCVWEGGGGGALFLYFSPSVVCSLSLSLTLPLSHFPFFSLIHSLSLSPL